MAEDTRRHKADTPDAVAPPPDASLIPDEPERGDESNPDDLVDKDEAVENIDKEGEPFQGNFA